MIRTQTVNGTTALRGGVADILAAAAGAGFLSDTLPGEVLAQVTAPVEAAATAPVVEQVAAGSGSRSKYKYTRPNGEAFFARKITFGDRETTDVEVTRDGIKGVGKDGLSMFFIGQPGCGKTAMIEASCHDWEFTNGIVTMLCNGSTTAADFVGGMMPQPDGTFVWQDGPLVRAMDEGKAFYVDEIGRVDSKELVVMYGVMDGRGVLEIPENPQRGTVRAKPGFFVIASTNPSAPGCVMDDALLSRFSSPIEYTTDFGIAVRYLGVPTDVAALARDMTKQVRNGTAYWAPTMRDLLQWKTAEAIFGARAAWQGLVGVAPVEAQPEVEAAIESATGMKISGGWVM
jgi:nitric oxide reductase NorQ protein